MLKTLIWKSVKFLNIKNQFKLKILQNNFLSISPKISRKSNLATPMFISTLYSFIHWQQRGTLCALSMSYNRRQLFFISSSIPRQLLAVAAPASHSQLIFSSFTDDTKCHEDSVMNYDINFSLCYHQKPSRRANEQKNVTRKVFYQHIRKST